jgi:hypothetical protein
LQLWADKHGLNLAGLLETGAGNINAGALVQALLTGDTLTPAPEPQPEPEPEPEPEPQPEPEPEPEPQPEPQPTPAAQNNAEARAAAFIASFRSAIKQAYGQLVWAHLTTGTPRPARPGNVNSESNRLIWETLAAIAAGSSPTPDDEPPTPTPEPEPATPRNETANGGRIAQALRAKADALTSQIHAKYNSATSRQRPTRRRARIAESMRCEGKALEATQQDYTSAPQIAGSVLLPGDGFWTGEGMPMRAHFADLCEALHLDAAALYEQAYKGKDGDDYEPFTVSEIDRID